MSDAEEPRTSESAEAAAPSDGESLGPRRKWGDTSREERRQIALKGISNMLSKTGSKDGLEGFPELTILSFIHNAFYNLRHYLESADDTPDVTWASPVAELEYETPWASFRAPDAGPALAASEETEPTDADLETADAAVAWGTDTYLRMTERVLLHTLTHKVFYEVKRGKLVSYLPKELVGAPWADVAPLLRPWTMGGAVADTWWTDFLAEFGVIHTAGVEPADADLPSFTIIATARDDDGTPLTDELGAPVTSDIHPVIALYPAVVDRKAKRAHYPMLVGFVVEGMPLSEWSADERERIWEELFGAFEKIAGEWLPEPPGEGAEGEAVAAPVPTDAEPVRRGRPKTLPVDLTQQTYPEVAAIGYAMVDAPALRNWREAPGGAALVHSRKRASLQVRLELPSTSGEWGAQTLATANLKDALLAAGGMDTYLLAQVGSYLALRDTQVTISLDDLIRLIGWQTRSAKQREEQRAAIWRRLRLLDGLTIHGARPGEYADPDNPKRKTRVTSQDALFRITGKRLPEQGSFDPEQVPLEVTFVAGPLINAFRGHSDVLTFFGDFMPLAGIPGGQVGGAWARAIGAALHQRWREGAKDVVVTTPGEDNALCVKWRSFTRAELFALFEPQPTPASILEGNDPGRARTHWQQAIKRLELAGVIGYYKEQGTAAASRKGWQDAWLSQRLDIRPGPKWQVQAAQIAGAAGKADAAKKLKKRRRKPKPDAQ